jgi:tRNA threonylcarbamoyl adenosine modification protein (Sua5/YciO/YrdC/YwlC family)
LQHPGKKTVGVRIPRHVVTQALLAELGEPLVSSTLLLPGQDEPMTDGWQIVEQLGHAVDAVIDSGDCGTEPTTVIDFSQQEPEIVRRGAGDTSGFELATAISRNDGKNDLHYSRTSALLDTGPIRLRCLEYERP